MATILMAAFNNPVTEFLKSQQVGWPSSHHDFQQMSPILFAVFKVFRSSHQFFGPLNSAPGPILAAILLSSSDGGLSPLWIPWPPNCRKYIPLVLFPSCPSGYTHGCVSPMLKQTGMTTGKHFSRPSDLISLPSCPGLMKRVPGSELPPQNLPSFHPSASLPPLLQKCWVALSRSFCCCPSCVLHVSLPCGLKPCCPCPPL